MERHTCPGRRAVWRLYRGIAKMGVVLVHRWADGFEAKREVRCGGRGWPRV